MSKLQKFCVLRLINRVCSSIAAPRWVSLLVCLSAAQACAALTPGQNPNWATTAEPAQQGSTTNPFFDDRAIARWSVVPFQTYSQSYPVGLMALHGSGQIHGNEGIQKVEFIANNGAVETVTAPSVNPATGYWEWWTYLQTSAVDGIVEVRAIIYPYDGRCRVLQGGYVSSLGSGQKLPDNGQSLLLWSNKQGTYNKVPIWVASDGSDSTGVGSEAKPYATIGKAVTTGYNGDANNGTIYLKAGTYPMYRTTATKTLNSSRWLCVEAAPGVPRENVIIGGNTDNSTARTQLRLVRFRNVSFDYRTPSTFTIYGPSTTASPQVWLDGASVNGASASSAFSSYFSTCNIVAITKNADHRIAWSNWNSGPVAPLVLGVDVTATSGDVFTRNKFTRDFSVNGTVKLVGNHPDLWQSYGSGSNRILMDGFAIGNDMQLIFLDNGLPDNLDVALVNLILSTNNTGLSQAGGPAKHVLLWNVELAGQSFRFQPDSTKPGRTDEFGVCGSIFQKLIIDSSVDTATWYWKSNQFLYSNPFGSDSALVNPSYDAHYYATSQLTTPRTVRWDYRQTAREASTLRGAYSNQISAWRPNQPTNLHVTAN